MLFVVHAILLAMELHQCGDDAESQAVAAEDPSIRAGPRFIDLVERLPDAGLIFHRYLNTVIINADAIGRTFIGRRDDDALAGWRVIDGVADVIT